MTYTLELTPEEIQRIEAAERKGIRVQILMRGCIASLPDAINGNGNGVAYPTASPPLPRPSSYAGLAAPWSEERRQTAIHFLEEIDRAAEGETPEEIAEAEREQTELLANMHRSRYPELYEDTVAK